MAKNRFASLLAGITNEPETENTSVLIIDGLNTFLRNFSIINHIHPSGHHIGGLTGFLKSLGYAIKTNSPTKVIIVFDGVGGSNAKRNLYPAYKANRNADRITNYKIFNNKEEESESISDQMERLIQYLQSLPVSLISIDGIEADDVMGYLAQKYESVEDCKRVTIMSADQDFLQLVSNKVNIHSPTKKKIYDIDSFTEEYGIHPRNYLLYKTFMGDKGDNVPKVKGLGEDKLLKILPQLKGPAPLQLEPLLESLDPYDKWGSQLLNFSHQLRINYRLMNLRDVPLSNENIEIIENSVAFKREYNKPGFLHLYYKDNLGNGVPNVETWLSEVFGYLSTF
jgi:5'-3' exonuclease